MAAPAPRCRVGDVVKCITLAALLLPLLGMAACGGDPSNAASKAEPVGVYARRLGGTRLELQIQDDATYTFRVTGRGHGTSWTESGTWECDRTVLLLTPSEPSDAWPVVVNDQVIWDGEYTVDPSLVEDAPAAPKLWRLVLVEEGVRMGSVRVTHEEDGATTIDTGNATLLRGQ